MLKKAGIVIAALAATSVAAAPLAFASVDYDYNSDNSVDRAQYNRCSFEQNSYGNRDAVLGVVPLVGEQTQTLNCTNVGDVTVLDLNGTANDVTVPAGTITPASGGGGTTRRRPPAARRAAPPAARPAAPRAARRRPDRPTPSIEGPDRGPGPRSRARRTPTSHRARSTTGGSCPSTPVDDRQQDGTTRGSPIRDRRHGRRISPVRAPAMRGDLRKRYVSHRVVGDDHPLPENGSTRETARGRSADPGSNLTDSNSLHDSGNRFGPAVRGGYIDCSRRGSPQ